MTPPDAALLCRLWWPIEKRLVIPLLYNHKAAGNWSSSKFGNLMPAQKTKIFWKQVHKIKN